MWRCFEPQSWRSLRAALHLEANPAASSVSLGLMMQVLLANTCLSPVRYSMRVIPRTACVLDSPR